MIQFEEFLNWAENRFGDVLVRGDEILINCVFHDGDYKRHLSCNPYGGKHKISSGVYHCWRCEASGSLVSLVMHVDNCPYDEALERIGGTDSILFNLEQRVEEMFNKKQSPEEKVPGTLELPEGTQWIKDLPASSFWRAEGEAYLEARKLNPAEYMICTAGDFTNRIIIPYFDKLGKLIYWNGRFLSDSKKIPKYMGPHKDTGVSKGDVIYMASPTWPDSGLMHVTEGEFDAKSIFISGLNACAIGGKAILDKQILMLRPYSPVLCFDTDSGKRVDAGGVALLKIGDKLKNEGFDVYYVRPPGTFKDWNNMLMNVGPRILAAYIEQNRKIYTDSTSLELKLK